MDEIFGYFPPTANPPSKKPMLLLLKQARAYGVGIVLATQNPVDLDYKGLSNIGSWFVGRLQTRQDQDHVVEGIVGASDGKLDVRLVKNLLSDMKGRQFLLNSVHLDEPLLFETRWVMSYLKGPISKSDIKKLMEKKRGMAGTDSSDENRTQAVSSNSSEPLANPPMLARGIDQLYFLHNVLREEISFAPWLWATASVRFYNSRRNIDIVKEVSLRLYLDERFHHPDWPEAEAGEYSVDDCVLNGPDSASFFPLPAAFSKMKNLNGLKKGFSEYLYQNERQELFRIRETKFESTPGESSADFKVRFSDFLREQKDEAVEKLRGKYKLRQERIEKKLQTAFNRLEKEKVDVKTRTTDSLISFGAAVVGAFFGRKAFSASNIGKAVTGVRGVSRVAKEQSDVTRAEEKVQVLQQELDELSMEIEEKINTMTESFDIDTHEAETFAIKPRRSDIFDVRLMLLWEMTA
ncbi:MAG: ATP-binding protein [Deltaproteobacteria bacterium]|nr:ATP-binding protein [Deltaproteobacteria bacterium]